jgi:translation initiation factor IF-1
MKQQNVEVTGTVEQELGNSMFRVSLDKIEDSSVLCTISGKIRQNKIRIIAGDRVKIEMSPYDLTKGRIVTRLRLDNN